MVKRNFIETIMGAVVLIVALGFVVFAYNSGRVRTINGYNLSAKFDRADGLTIGSDVRVSGIKIGSVTDQQVDPQTYQAQVKMAIENSIKLPKDSTAEIVSDGLLGSKYVALVPGGENDMLQNNEEIKYTQSSVSIEQLIGKFMFSGDSKKQQGENQENKESSVGKANTPSLGM